MGFRYPKLLVPALSATLICLFLSSCGKGYAGKIILAGSTSVEPFAELWAEAYAVTHPEVNVIIQGGGSSAGVESALTGTSDIGMSSRELKPEEEFDSGGQKILHIVPVAFDAIAVIANAKSPLTNITSAQLRNLFAGHIDKLDARPVTVVTREEGSGTRKSFEESVMKAPGSKTMERISNSALVQDSNGAIREIVAGDPNAIGYISLGLVDKRVKPLAIDNILPTVETIKNGNYKIVRRFLFVLKTRNNPLSEDFIKFCLSPEGQNLVAKKGLIKIKETK
ncbi:MAG: phosphate ABC transporter substrate-binding protein [Candidatus Omnitrophica bacterium]|nr:phosphate ABC transporter substrate-binding protein [Candidatus Omnitrophota bacterium]